MVDVRLNAIVDPAVAGSHTMQALTGLVVSGGATLIQLRDKHGDTRRQIETAKAIMAVLENTGVALVINDRVDVALAAKADGVHVGQTDMSVAEARGILGPGAIIGLSIKTIAEAEAAPVELLDYVGVGGVYATTSKDNPNRPIGLDGLRAIVDIFHRRAPGLPVVAIAGITATNAADTVTAGADGVAVISALSLAPDATAAARELRAAVDAARAKRGDV
jgi:thiamine-phosphate pyrophosphorylase